MNCLKIIEKLLFLSKVEYAAGQNIVYKSLQSFTPYFNVLNFLYCAQSFIKMYNVGAIKISAHTDCFMQEKECNYYNIEGIIHLNCSVL